MRRVLFFRMRAPRSPRYRAYLCGVSALIVSAMCRFFGIPDPRCVLLSITSSPIESLYGFGSLQQWYILRFSSSLSFWGSFCAPDRVASVFFVDLPSSLYFSRRLFFFLFLVEFSIKRFPACFTRRNYIFLRLVS